MNDLNLRPEDYPDHETWIGDLTRELAAHGTAFVTVRPDNPLELDRRLRVLEGLIEEHELPLDVSIDVDVLVVDRTDNER